MSNYDELLIDAISFAINQPRENIPTLWSHLQDYQNSAVKDISVVNMLEEFALFHPYSAGAYKSRAALTIQSIKQIFPALLHLSNTLELKKVKASKLSDFLTTDDQHRNAEDLKTLFDKYQSDKAKAHNYYYLYSDLLKDRHEVKKIFEIGLGTNNTEIVSNMGSGGKPGASLRAFRDFLPNSIIYGADVDRDILFREDRIETYWVDQTDRSSFNEINSNTPNDFDLMIDDGLHSPNANIHSLEFFLPKLKIGGWAIIEDIGSQALPVWEFIGSLLPDKYEVKIFNCSIHSLFCVNRLS